MGYRTYEAKCDFCLKNFQTSRSDSKFCEGKCRTAHSRREKRRAKAQAKMDVEWEGTIIHDYRTLIGYAPQVESMIQDCYIANGSVAASEAVDIALHTAQHITAIRNREASQLNQRIHVLTKAREMMVEINKITDQFEKDVRWGSL